MLTLALSILTQGSLSDSISTHWVSTQRPLAPQGPQRQAAITQDVIDQDSALILTDMSFALLKRFAASPDITAQLKIQKRGSGFPLGSFGIQDLNMNAKTFREGELPKLFVNQSSREKKTFVPNFTLSMGIENFEVPLSKRERVRYHLQLTTFADAKNKSIGGELSFDPEVDGQILNQDAYIQIDLNIQKAPAIPFRVYGISWTIRHTDGTDRLEAQLWLAQPVLQLSKKPMGSRDDLKWQIRPFYLNAKYHRAEALWSNIEYQYQNTMDDAFPPTRSEIRNAKRRQGSVESAESPSPESESPSPESRAIESRRDILATSESGQWTKGNIHDLFNLGVVHSCRFLAPDGSAPHKRSVLGTLRFIVGKPQESYDSLLSCLTHHLIRAQSESVRHRAIEIDFSLPHQPGIHRKSTLIWDPPSNYDHNPSLRARVPLLLISPLHKLKFVWSHALDHNGSITFDNPLKAHDLFAKNAGEWGHLLDWTFEKPAEIKTIQFTSFRNTMTASNFKLYLSIHAFDNEGQRLIHLIVRSNLDLSALDESPFDWIPWNGQPFLKAKPFLKSAFSDAFSIEVMAK